MRRRGVRKPHTMPLLSADNFLARNKYLVRHQLSAMRSRKVRTPRTMPRLSATTTCDTALGIPKQWVTTHLSAMRRRGVRKPHTMLRLRRQHHSLPATNSWCIPSCPQCGVAKSASVRCHDLGQHHSLPATNSWCTPTCPQCGVTESASRAHIKNIITFEINRCNLGR